MFQSSVRPQKSFKSSFTVALIEKEMKEGYYLANLFQQGDEEGNKARTVHLIESLLQGGDPVRLRSYCEDSRPSGSYQLACLGTQVSCILQSFT